MTVDLNADLGEGSGHDDELLALVSSANIACGLHAGSVAMMRDSIQTAHARGVQVGAHPSFDDRENFGRREISLPTEEIFQLVSQQVESFQKMANSLGVVPRHVKPHGALYNMAARDDTVASAVARAVATSAPGLLMFAPAGSALAHASERCGLRVAREVFADRNYLADGSLVPRGRPEAVLHDPMEAAKRVFAMLRENNVTAIDGSEVPIAADTICLHGDTPGAVEFARELRRALREMGIFVAAME